MSIAASASETLAAQVSGPALALSSDQVVASGMGAGVASRSNLPAASSSEPAVASSSELLAASTSRPAVASSSGSASADTAQIENPWAPLVLSLDGGGVRGLSSLYILRRIMTRIKELDNESNAEDRLEITQDSAPLPSHYFDLIVGTSTGGLIAIMLGRLHMTVDQCIQQYWIMTNRIFRPQKLRFVQVYSRRRVQDAAKEVVKQFCRCHAHDADECTGLENLRQFDYRERGSRENKTCKSAVITVREGGATTFRTKQADVTVMFRSYNHERRIPLSEGGELNPRADLESSQLKIHEAVSCTSAGPTYFRSVLLKGRRYIDGGVAANNPAMLAWNEATFMANPPVGPGADWQAINLPKALVSIGTGKAKEHSRFGNVSLMKRAFRQITDTTQVHEAVGTTIRQHKGSKYFRFDVPENPDNPNHKGLAGVGMDQCKKTRMRKSEQLASSSQDPPQNQPTQNGNTSPVPGIQSQPTYAAIKREETSDRLLQRQAMEASNGSYDPFRYRYKTFDKIRDRTVKYLKSNDGDKSVEDKISECARLLYATSAARRNADQTRWKEFRNHPDPSNPDHNPPGSGATQPPRA